MRDAAYGLLTADDRVDGHRAAAHYLEARGEPDALVLAEHFHQGRDAARAIHYYLQAAEQSYETHDMVAVLACTERGLRCGAQGEQRGAFLSLAVAAYFGREQYAEAFTTGNEAIALLPEGSKLSSLSADADIPLWDRRWWRRVGETLWTASVAGKKYEAALTWADNRFWGLRISSEDKPELEVNWDLEAGNLFGTNGWSQRSAARSCKNS